MTSPRSRVDSVPLIGGRACLDLVNTVSWRGTVDRREDHLDDAAACLVWSRRVGLLDTEEAARLDGLDVRRPLLDLRTALDNHLVGDLAAGPDLEALQPHIRDALLHSHLVLDGDRVRWQPRDLDADTLARRVALDLLDLVTNPPGPLRSCGDPDCGWVFVDTSHGHRRRWCSSADCGNRDRVRRHTARTRHR